MKITVLDGYTLNPGDLDWGAMAAFGDLTVYDRTPADKTVERAIGSEIVITNKTVLDADAISRLPELKYIGVLATGYNIVDVDAAASRGIVVTNIPSYSTMSVAQMAISLLLAIVQRVEHYADENRKGRWSRSEDFCYTDFPLMELAGKRFGVVWFGHTGQATAKVASALGMKVGVFSSKPQTELPAGYDKMDMDTLFKESDVVSLHCPLTDTTRHLVDSRRIETMKPSAILINTGRGPLIDEQAVADALREGRIYAAGMDVLGTEPPAADNPLLTAPRCFITPHIAWATKEARVRLMDIAVGNVAAFLSGKPQNVVG